MTGRTESKKNAKTVKTGAAVRSLAAFMAAAALLLIMPLSAWGSSVTGEDPGPGKGTAGVNAPSGELPPWTLYETEEYSVILTDALEPDSGEARFLVTIVNNSDYTIRISLKDFLLNDTARLSETGYGTCKPHKADTEELYSLNKWLVQFGDDLGPIEKITLNLNVNVEDPDTYKNISSTDRSCTVLLPENYEPAMLFETSFSMKAEEQVLFEDENRRIELRGLGRSPDSTDLYAITGIIHVINKSERPIPVDCPGLRVNGFYMDPYSYGGGSLAGGSERYLLFLCKAEDLELAGIEAISSIELLILTSDEENTGAYVADGGSWYPAALTQVGEDAAEGSEDILIYEDDIVTVSFREAWLEWHDVSYTDPYGYYHWILTVENKSSENIEFALSDILVGGVSEGELPGSNRVWPHTTDMGSGSRTVVHLKQSTDKDSPVPELSFRIQERTFGGGTLLHYSGERAMIEGGQGKRGE